MNDRTAIILSLVCHVGIFLSLIISTWANLRTPTKYMPVDIIPLEVEKSQPIPEPPKPEPEVKKEPEEKKPKLSEEAIQMMKNQLNKMKTPTKTPRPTQKPKPTPPPTRRKPSPTRTPLPTMAATLIPLEHLSNLPTPVPAAQIKTASESHQIFIDADSQYDFSSYAGTLNHLLNRAWRPPAVTPPELREYVTVMSFAIYRDGTIANIEMVSSSGWPLLDQTVREAVKRANPVEPLPPTYSSARIRVRVPFVLPANH